MATNNEKPSRKRPAPTTSSHRPPARSSNLAAAAPSLRIDTLLAKYARDLPPGGTISIQLIKGGTSTSVDPIAIRKAVAKKERQLQQRAAAQLQQRAAGGSGFSSGVSSGNDSDGGVVAAASAANTVAAAAANTAAAAAAEKLSLTFPRIAKFPETISNPNFFTGSLRDGRMYEEEVPLAKDEDDESDEDGGGITPKKKKRRWRRNAPRPRRWVLQEKSEFFERIAAKRRKQKLGRGDVDMEGGNKLSNQYHGVVESNASKYVILTVAPSSSTTTVDVSSSTTGSSLSNSCDVVASEQITIQPIYGFHTFSQPYKTATLSMEEAESAIERQRNTVTRYMMHGKLSNIDTNEAAATIATGGVRGGRSLGPAPKALSRARLLGKLAGNDDVDDEDDVMGDLKFESRRGGGTARKELLSSMADEGTTMDDDGVLGGANDLEFGGKRRFGRAAVETSNESSAAAAGEKGGGAATGFEAGAMEDGFYQRDVSAEYEALDYDANEQFDDDDVNLGEDEILDDGGGFGGDFDSGDDQLSDDDASDDEIGMATAAGLRAMLAKARGESPVNEVADKTVPDVATAAQGSNGIEDNAKKGVGVEKRTEESKPSNGTIASKPAPKEAVGVEIGADGKRKITLEAVRREIWLNSGSIKTTKLMKKFDVTKEFPARQAVFKKIVMELCTMKKDADGNKLVLKQHYSK